MTFANFAGNGDGQSPLPEVSEEPVRFVSEKVTASASNSFMQNSGSRPISRLMGSPRSPMKVAGVAEGKKPLFNP